MQKDLYKMVTALTIDHLHSFTLGGGHSFYKNDLFTSKKSYFYKKIGPNGALEGMIDL